MNENQYDQEKLAEELSQYLKDIAQLKYDSEIRREDSLVLQASQMQTAFSFTSAALFMVAAIAVEYKDPWTYEFLLLVFSSITIALVISLVFATIAQRRSKRKDFKHIDSYVTFVTENYKESDTQAKRNIQWVNLLSEIEKDLSRTNDNKVVFIKWSMIFFYISLGLSLFWFIIALAKM